MTLVTVVTFCRLRQLIFVEETLLQGQESYTFLDHHGTKLTFTGKEIFEYLCDKSNT